MNENAEASEDTWEQVKKKESKPQTVWPKIKASPRNPSCNLLSPSHLDSAITFYIKPLRIFGGRRPLIPPLLLIPKSPLSLKANAKTQSNPHCLLLFPLNLFLILPSTESPEAHPKITGILVNPPGNLAQAGNLKSSTGMRTCKRT